MNNENTGRFRPPEGATRTMNIPLYGHQIVVRHVKSEFLKHRDIHVRLRTENVAEGKEPGYATGIRGISRECWRCGRPIFWRWDESDDSDPVTTNQFERTPPLLDTERYRPVRLPADTVCPVTDLLPLTVRFTCRSGRIAIGYNLDRLLFEDAPRFASGSYLGQRDRTAWFAERGLLTGHFWEMSPHFVPRDYGLEGLWMDTDTDDPQILADEAAGYCEHENWFCIVDASDAPDGSDAKLMDLAPGEYEMVLQYEDHDFFTTTSGARGQTKHLFALRRVDCASR